MAKQKDVNKSPERTKLLKEKSVFKSELLERKKIGEDLLSKMKSKVTTIPNAYMAYGYERRTCRNELTEEQEELVSKFRQWTDYNSELLKQAFDIPNNEYCHNYNSCGQRIVFSRNEDLFSLDKDELKSKIEYLDTLIAKIPLLPSCNTQLENTDEMNIVNADSKRIFIVHGHDTNARTQVELLVKTLGYEPVVLFKEPNAGCTIIEKIEREASNSAYAIILYTACDLGNDKEDAAEHLNLRARQNVVFEHGYMCALLGRNKVCAILEHDVEFPGDLSGIVYIKLDDGGTWRFSVAKEMKAAGLDVDLNKL